MPRKAQPLPSADESFSNPALAFTARAVIEMKRRKQSGLAVQLDYVNRYYDDLPLWLVEVINWNPNDKSDYPSPYQFDFARILMEHHRLSGMGPHGLGKSGFMAMVTWWFVTTSEAACAINKLASDGQYPGLPSSRDWAFVTDWKLISTAGSWKQLTNFLWPEIRKWSKRVRWEIVGRPEPRSGADLLQLEIQMPHGKATAVASTDPQLIEGAHAPRILFLYDESKAIPGRTFDATEGAFSTAGPDTGRQAFAVSFSTPGPTEGRFYEIQSDPERPPEKRKFEHWAIRQVTLQETIDAGRNSEEWPRIMAKQWGIDNPTYINRVLGKFSKTRADGVIPYLWVEAAMERWDEYGTVIEGQILPAPKGRLTHVGADPADSGADDSVIAARYGPYIDELIYFRPDRPAEGESEQGVMAVADAIEHELSMRTLNPRKVKLAVDALGVGAGVASYLRTKKRRDVLFFKASQRAGRGLDPTQTFGFDSRRSQAWWYLRTLLDPENETPIALPSDERLLQDLTAPNYEERNGLIVIESKDILRKVDRLGRSPDAGDAVVMAFYLDIAESDVSLGGALPIEIGVGRGGSTREYGRKGYTRGKSKFDSYL